MHTDLLLAMQNNIRLPSGSPSLMKEQAAQYTLPCHSHSVHFKTAGMVAVEIVADKEYKGCVGGW